MKGKRGLTWIQAHNLTVTATRGQIVLAGDLYDHSNDHGGLHPSLRQAHNNRDQAGITSRTRAHLADAGYASAATFTTPSEGILLIATSRDTGQADAHTRSTDPDWQRMTNRLNNPAGKRLYRRRAGMIEPIFAQLFHHGGRQLHHRGPAAGTEITLMITAHNAGKLFAHQQRQTNRRRQT
ncbi:transposase [Dactylosporangium sp. NPDC000555]|uniref:transposase n=1 Tax=Dactylosporangium sp. NPDC000555 TaxID=3154260 RepID=UPI00332554EE